MKIDLEADNPIDWAIVCGTFSGMTVIISAYLAADIFFNYSPGVVESIISIVALGYGSVFSWKKIEGLLG